MYEMMILKVYTKDGVASINLTPEQMEKVERVLNLKITTEKDGITKLIAGGITPYKLSD